MALWELRSSGYGHHYADRHDHRERTDAVTVHEVLLSLSVIRGDMRNSSNWQPGLLRPIGLRNPH
jgi:hypothetical protein